MSRQRIIVIAVVICLGLIAGGMVWSYDREKQKGLDESHAKPTVVLAMGAKIAIDQAMTIALDNFPGQVVEVQLEQNGNQTVWNVDVVTAERGVMVVRVNAESGWVIMTGEKSEMKSRDSETQRKL